jgi:hypothetical protein
MAELGNFEYQAYGILELKVFHDVERDKYFGVLQPEEAENKTIINLDLPNWVKNQLDSKIKFSELVNTNQPIKCGLYPRTNQKLELNFSIKNVYLGEIKPERKKFTLKGEIVDVNFELLIASIQIKPKSSKLKPFSISFIYNESLTGLKHGQFWEIKAVLESGVLQAQSGKLLIDKAKSNQLEKSQTQYPVTLKGNVATESENKCTIKNVENNKHNFQITKKSNIMEVKSEITIKFSGVLPQSQPAPNKKVEVQVTDQNGIVFTALLNAKSWRKAEATTAEFADWAGAISGKLGKTEKGFEIIDGGISIFEKKVKQEVASVEVNKNALS